MCAQLGSVESTECLCKRCTYPRMYDHRGYVCINGSGATKPVHIRSYLNHFQHTHTHTPTPARGGIPPAINPHARSGEKSSEGNLPAEGQVSV